MGASTWTSCPANERKFGTPWGELAYLCRKTHYHLHVSQDRSRAGRFAPRIRETLTRCRARGAIITETAKALLHEYDGNWKQAARYRERELELVVKLHRIMMDHEPKTRAYALQGRTRRDMQTCLSQVRKTYVAKATEREATRIDQLRRMVQDSL